MYMMSGEVPGRNGNGHFVHVPYDTFRTRTRHLIVAVLTDRCWADLVVLLGDETLLDPAFATQPGRLAKKGLLVQRIQACLERETCEYWLDALGKAKVPAAPVNDIGDAFADPQGLARQMRVSVPLHGGGSVDQPGNPVKLSETHEDVFTPPPPVGFDTAAVLGELLSLDTRAIGALADAGAIGLHS